jgi:hypothetical protein
MTRLSEPRFPKLGSKGGGELDDVRPECLANGGSFDKIQTALASLVLAHKALWLPEATCHVCLRKSPRCTQALQQFAERAFWLRELQFRHAAKISTLKSQTQNRMMSP